jgi:hypothetical protein
MLGLSRVDKGITMGQFWFMEGGIEASVVISAVRITCIKYVELRVDLVCGVARTSVG